MGPTFFKCFLFCVHAVFAIEREQAGLRRICGYGVTITRGAASAMMFTYASLLVTMCRNLITFLRDTFLHSYIPFDDAVSMHKYIAFLAGVFTRQYLFIYWDHPWGHSGPLCHALSLSSLLLSSWTSMRRRRATVPLATPAEWACGGLRGEWAQHFSNASCLIIEAKQSNAISNKRA